MGHDGPVEPAVTPVTEPLAVAALDTERHVATQGWDQPPRLFALVPTARLLEAEPHLADGLGPADLAPGALTAIEQDDLPAAPGIEDLLARIAWPPTVAGCALVVERVVLPPDAERDLEEALASPGGSDAAVRALAAHPDHEDVRLLVAVTRDGRAICLLRQRTHDRDDRVASGPDIAPGLVAALRATLEDEVAQTRIGWR